MLRQTTASSFSPSRGGPAADACPATPAFSFLLPRGRPNAYGTYTTYSTVHDIAA